jgi:hypothetical protein
MSQEHRVQGLKRRISLIIIVMLLGLGCAGYKWVKIDGVSQIQDIRVTGLSQLKLADIKEVIKVDLQSSWENINVEEIEVAIMSIDLVESVQVSLGVDQVLIISVTEPEIIALNYDKGWCRLYSNGHRNCLSHELIDVPIVEVKSLENTDWSNLANYLVTLKKEHIEIYDDLSMLVVDSDQVNAHFISHRVKVKLLLREVQTWKKYNYLLTHFAESLMKKKELDLRFVGYAYAS